MNTHTFKTRKCEQGRMWSLWLVWVLRPSHEHLFLNPHYLFLKNFLLHDGERKKTLTKIWKNKKQNLENLENISGLNDLSIKILPKEFWWNLKLWLKYKMCQLPIYKTTEIRDNGNLLPETQQKTLLEIEKNCILF